MHENVSFVIWTWWCGCTLYYLIMNNKYHMRFLMCQLVFVILLIYDKWASQILSIFKCPLSFLNWQIQEHKWNFCNFKWMYFLYDIWTYTSKIKLIWIYFERKIVALFVFDRLTVRYEYFRFRIFRFPTVACLPDITDYTFPLFVPTRLKIHF